MSPQIIQLRSEIVSCTEERDELTQSVARWRDQVNCLEKSNFDIRGLISILEDDIRAGKKEYEALQSSMDKLKEEKEQVLRPHTARFTKCRVEFD